MIQVFEDGNPGCVHFSGIWDSAAEEYGSIVKFGRINVGSQRDLLKKLPIKVQIFPTVISMARGYEHNIFTFFHHSRLIELRKFIEKSIENYVEIIDNNRFTELWKQWHDNKNLPEVTESRKPEIMFFNNKDKSPLIYKYNAMMLNKWINFYQNSFGEANKMAKTTKSPELDFLVSLDKYDPENELFKKETYLFAYNDKIINNNHFKKVINFMKFNMIPDIHKETLRIFCGEDDLRSDKTSVYEELNDEIAPELCVLILKNSTRLVIRIPYPFINLVIRVNSRKH